VTSVTGSGGAVVSASTTVPNVSLAYGTAANTVCQGNDGRLSDSRAASDVSAWAKAGTKPSYSVGEVSGAAPTASPTFTGNITLPGGKWETGGNVGIGTASPLATLDVRGVVGSYGFALPQGGSNTGGEYGSAVGTHPVSAYENYGWNFTVQEVTQGQFSVGNASRTAKYLTVKHGGNVGIGDTDPADKLSVAGTIHATSTITGSDITADSDERLKENIVTIPDALAKVLALRGVGFSLRADAAHEPKVGLIAQEVQAVFPEVVRAGEDGMLSVSYGSLVGALVEAVKAQQKQIDALRNRPSLWRRFMRWVRGI
jgi:hypothetical protein